MQPTSESPPSKRLQWDSISAFLRYWLEENPLGGPERQVFETYYSTYRRRFSPYIQHCYAEQTQEIAAAIRSAASPALLEVGTGCGTEALWFSLLGADVTGIDLAADRLGVARARKEWLQAAIGTSLRVDFQRSSVFDFAPGRTFDLIWMEQTFHHLEPRDRVYSRLFELLRPGGTLFISETNGWNLLVQAQLFLRRGWRTRTSFIDERGIRVEYGNERITTPSALRKGLARAGFDVRATRSFRMLPDSDPPPAWLSVERSILKVFPALSTHYNVVARRPPPGAAG